MPCDDEWLTCDPEPRPAALIESVSSTVKTIVRTMRGSPVARMGNHTVDIPAARCNWKSCQDDEHHAGSLVEGADSSAVRRGSRMHARMSSSVAARTFSPSNAFDLGQQLNVQSDRIVLKQSTGFIA
jgi:hypothetical protein